jgi:hypothetical protein
VGVKFEVVLSILLVSCRKIKHLSLSLSLSLSLYNTTSMLPACALAAASLLTTSITILLIAAIMSAAKPWVEALLDKMLVEPERSRSLLM